MNRFRLALASIVIGVAGLGTAATAQDSMMIAMVPQISVDTTMSGDRIAERRDWRNYFKDISRGGIAISIDERRLSYWSPGAEHFMEFPIGAPREGPEFAKRGRTSVVRKKVDPDWRPTAAMKQRDPSLPDFLGAGPTNPLGHRAMYLGWPAYLIHGTNQPETIGTRVSSGCFRMFPQHVELLYEWVEPGTPVYVF